MLTTKPPALTSDFLALIREVELRRVDANGDVYLDYTGSALYPESIVRQHFALLTRRTLGNPHSTNPAALASTEDIEIAKSHILHFFDADRDEYDVCLTGNTSAAIRLVAESFPWQTRAHCVLTADNHNSMNGIREYARAGDATVSYVPLGDEMRIPELRLPELRRAPGLFGFPAQSNFSGVRHSLNWVAEAQSQGYSVLLDVAAYVPTNALSLRRTPADFVALSFYKMFGYPTGCGALIARKSALAKLRRPSFAGGTVDFVSVANRDYQLKSNMEAFEDGTVNFLAASAIPIGLCFLERIGMPRIHAHVERITEALIERLLCLQHRNGRPMVDVYGPTSTADRGGTVAFNVVDETGALVNCDDVVNAAAAARISLRSGCFCNPGAAEHVLGVTRRGAVRASVGYGSNHEDIDSLIIFLKGAFT